MQEILRENEIEFLEHFYHPCSLTECLVPENFQLPHVWPHCKPLYLRPYQHAMQNYSYIYANDPNLTLKENFRIKKMVGDCYQIGARDLGKSIWLIVDNILSIIHGLKEIMLASDCAEHLKKVTEPIANIVESHKFLKMFHLQNSRSETVNRNFLTVTTEHGCVVRSVNEKADTKNPGTQYHGKHCETMFYEEYSYASAEGMKKAVDAGTSFGRIERFSGIPDLCIGSPLGKILSNTNNKPWIWRLPQLVKEDWDSRIEEEKADLYGGKKSISYLLNVLAEIIEGAFGFFDMERLKEASVKKSGMIKSFEIGKDNFAGFEERLIIERPAGTEKVFIAADLGFGSAPTEIIIVFYDGKKYKYDYNVSLIRLTPEEQPDVIKWIYDKLGKGFVALDSTSDNSAMIERLFKLGIPREHLLAVKFNENIEVGFEKDENENVIVDSNGDPIMKMANTEDWSFKELEKIFYSGVMEVPPDPKFLTQFTNTIAKQSKTRMMYDSKGEDHNRQAWQVFAICRFFNEFNNIRTVNKPKVSLGVFNKTR